MTRTTLAALASWSAWRLAASRPAAPVRRTAPASRPSAVRHARGARREARQLDPEPGAKTYRRRGLYLHDSHKGFTHGYVETRGTVLDRLIQYRKDHPTEKTFPVRVNYTGSSNESGHEALTASEAEVQTLAALIIACVAAGSDAPLRVGGVPAEYCANEHVVEMTVENISDAMVLASFSVERLDASGEWTEFSSDVLGTQRYPKKAFAIPLAAKASRTIHWRPRVNSNERAWNEGSYRVIAHWLVEKRPPGRQAVVAAFIVRKGPRCTEGTEPKKPIRPQLRGR